VPTEIFLLEIVNSLIVPAVAIVVLGLPLVRVLARRLDRSGPAPRSLIGMEERLARIEGAVDTIAVEVERISEGQRFTAKLLAERSEAGAAKSTAEPTG
jgi:hypothetical protein